MLVPYIFIGHIVLYLFRIESGQALRNLLVIMRLHWPEDVIHQSDVERLTPDWWDLIIDEFFVSKFYTSNSFMSFLLVL